LPAGAVEVALPLRIERIVERVDVALLLAAKRYWQRIPAPRTAAARRPTLLVAGVQRSGTNMVMDVLERSYETHVHHERDPRAFRRYQLREDAVIRDLIAASPAPLVVVKCLMESQKLAALLERFAPARALWVFRDYRDVANSMVRSFRNQAAQVRRIAQDRGSDGWLGECMSDETHRVVRDLAAGELDDLSAAALQWYFRNVRYFEQGLDRDARVLPVHYDRLVTNPEDEFRRICAFASISFRPRLLKRIRATSIHRHAAPAIRSDIAAVCDALYARLRSTTTTVRAYVEAPARVTPEHGRAASSL
jgi:hypothetical protein